MLNATDQVKAIEAIKPSILNDLRKSFPSCASELENSHTYQVMTGVHNFAVVWIPRPTYPVTGGPAIGTAFVYFLGRNFDEIKFLYAAFYVSRDTARDILHLMSQGYHAGYMDACGHIIEDQKKH
jgi:hypothetical protein